MKFIKREVYLVDSDELESKIRELYDKDWDIDEEVEPSSDTSIDVHLKKGDKAYMEEPSYADYMQDMINKDIIPAGYWYIGFDF